MNYNIPSKSSIWQEILTESNKENSKQETQKSSDINVLRESCYQANKIKEASKLNVDRVKSIFLAECLDNIFEGCLENTVEKSIRMSLINTFIKENGGINKIIKSFKTKNYVLSEMVFYIEKQTKSLMEACEDLDDKQISIKATEQTPELIANLDDYESKKVEEKVADRVAQAVSDFVQTNKASGEAIKDVMTKAQEKVNDTVNENKIMAIQKDMGTTIYNIRNGNKKTLYEHMVNYISKQSLAIMENKQEFSINESMDKAKIMYTFLEMQNTLSMADINKNYVSELIKNMK